MKLRSDEAAIIFITQSSLRKLHPASTQTERAGERERTQEEIFLPSSSLNLAEEEDDGVRLAARAPAPAPETTMYRHAQQPAPAGHPAV